MMQKPRIDRVRNESVTDAVGEVWRDQSKCAGQSREDTNVELGEF